MRKRLSAEFLPGEDPGPAIAKLLAEAAAFALIAKLAPTDRDRLAIIVEELASNAARHGMSARKLRLTLDMSADERAIDIIIEDDGAPFDPTRRLGFSGPDPDTGGGVGLELVRAWCDRLAYSRDGATNRLILRLGRSPQ